MSCGTRSRRGGSLKVAEELVFRAIADSTYDWETWVGSDGQTRWINPAVERFTGYSVDECLVMPSYPLCLVHPPDRASITEALRSAAQGSAGNDLELRVEHRDGSVRWAAMSWQSLITAGGRVLGYRTSIRDIADRKRSEGRLLEALRRAQASELARATLLASVSHELRTPIHNLLGYAELLARRKLDSESKKQVRIILEQGAVLLSLVDDLLDVSAAETRRVARPCERFDLRAVVENVSESHRARIEGKGLQLGLELPSKSVPCKSDRAGTEQVLRILLDNAAKYTNHGHVMICVRPTEDGAIVDVKDSGMGIDPSELSEIRRAFVRGGDASLRGIDGLGLGLAIADRVCARMGATLTITSELGVGSCFSLRIPKAAPKPKRTKRTNHRPVLDVLVVDDRALGRELVAEMVRALGCQSDVASGAREALMKISLRHFDVVLLDVHMPELDGYATIHLLRAQLSASGRQLRVIALTADVFAIGDLERHGFDGHLEKPLSMDALEAFLFPKEEKSADSSSQPRAIDVLNDPRAGGGTSLWSRFAPKIITELRTLARALREDPETDHVRTVHSLKGTAQIVQGTALIAAIEALQTAITSGDREGTASGKALVAEAADALADELELRPG